MKSQHVFRAYFFLFFTNVTANTVGFFLFLPLEFPNVPFLFKDASAGAR